MMSDDGLVSVNAAGDRLVQPVYDWWDELTEDERSLELGSWMVLIRKKWENLPGRELGPAKNPVLAVVGMHYMLCRQYERRQGEPSADD